MPSATAVAMLSFAPVRLGNLIRIELGQNLIKPGGLNTPHWLVSPNYDVKNRRALGPTLQPPLLRNGILQVKDERRRTGS
jgi:hypothetical protein